MQYSEFCARLRQQGPEQLYLLTGEEQFYLERAQRELLAALFPEGEAAQAAGTTELPEGTPSGRIAEALETIPFFAPRNVVVIKGNALFKEKKQGTAGQEKTAEKKQNGGSSQEERLLSVLQDLPQTTTAIFVAPGKADKRRKIYKVLEKHGIVLEAEQLKAWQIADWLTERLRERQLKLDRGAEQYFVTAAGLMNPISLGFLDQELEKLGLFSQGRRVTEEEVREAFSNVPEVSGFALLDAIDARDAKRALSLLERQLAENTYLPLILSLLVLHVRRLAQAKLLLAKGIRGRQLGTPLELNPYAAERVGRAAGSYTAELLRQIYLQLVDADYYLKTGQQGAELLEQAVIRLVKRS